LRETPRTCEYYYVLSDRSGTMAGVHCTPSRMKVLRPGEQDERLPPVPVDTVMFSGGSRAEELSRRLHDRHGSIDVPAMIDIIKRPVAMNSNLHNAVFVPESLEMYFANAGKHSCACDEPYHRCALDELLRFYRAHAEAPR
ncbi:MAG: peptidase C45 acyl-coenzyme A:6-aminopenicillanic acid acyl-transferase, partial [Planctomycetales bacterium]|nr:peptidase C45 acyl-coenzyme A:6-aminopenicillanic acid acyl-transferase [Planctomycetales bacterium]